MNQPTFPDAHATAFTDDVASSSTTSLASASASLTTSSGRFPLRHDPYQDRIRGGHRGSTDDHMQPHHSLTSIAASDSSEGPSSSRVNMLPVSTSAASDDSPPPTSHPTPHATVAHQTTAQPQSMCCYFKQKQSCRMGDRCWFSHEGDLYTPCHFGLKCKAGHATLVPMQLMQSEPHSPVVRSLRESANALVAKESVTIRVGFTREHTWK